VRLQKEEDIESNEHQHQQKYPKHNKNNKYEIQRRGQRVVA
jgi:hypothetical protein